MKKILIGGAVVIAAAVGFFTLSKKGQEIVNTAPSSQGVKVKEAIKNAITLKETYIKDFATENLNKEIHIQLLENYYFIKKATIKITSFSETEAKSVINIETSLLGESATIELPLLHKIQLKDAENNGKKFEAGKITTTYDFSNLKVDGKPQTNLPSYITSDFLTEESYIGTDGSILSISNAKPISLKEDGKEFNFEGAKVVTNSNVNNFGSPLGDIVVEIKKFNYSKGDKKLSFNGATYSLKIDKDLNYTGTLSPLSFLVTDYKGNTSITTGKTDLSGKLEMVAILNTMGGNGTAVINNLEVKSPQSPLAVKFDKVKASFKMVNSENNKSVSIGYNFDLTPAKGIAKALGSPIDINNASFGINLNNIPNDILTFYMDKFNTVYLTGKEPEFTQEDISKLITAIFNSNIEYKIDYSVNSSDGNSKGALNVSPNKTDLPASEIISIFDQKKPQMLSLLNGSVDAQMDESLATKTGLSMMIQMAPMASMFLKLENGKYTVKGSLKDGKVTVNGNKIPIPGM